MPLYEYECAACEQVCELLVRSAEEELACPNCGGKQLTRQLSVTARPATASLPMAPPAGGCGRPQCGQGRCMGME
ncbi:MAG: zinc ribbon domain-containing protein [Planctomycetales bacterium]|nr:zinc ribbon domain-containing protein [Planctomycetales bacterium]